MKILLDTNVIIAAFATRGICHAIYELCLVSHEIVLSDYILHEVSRNLRKKLRMPLPQVEQIVTFLEQHACMVTLSPIDVVECPDPTDRMVLATALTGEVDYLVTGDAVLLGLHDVQQIPIISPRVFWERLRKQE